MANLQINADLEQNWYLTRLQTHVYTCIEKTLNLLMCQKLLIEKWWNQF